MADDVVKDTSYLSMEQFWLQYKHLKASRPSLSITRNISLKLQRKSLKIYHIPFQFAPESVEHHVAKQK